MSDASRYMGGSVELVETPTGAIVSADALASAAFMYTEPTVEEVVPGVWAIGGSSMVNVYVIEAENGLIVYDTGDNRAEGEHALEAIRSISDKPVKAVLYSHSHYAMGGGVLVDDPSDVLVIGHPKLNETVEANLQGGGAPSAIPEVGPVLTVRAGIQFNNFVPDDGPDAALGAKIDIGQPVAVLPVTRPVEDGEIVDVLGIKMQFFTEFVSDDYCLTVWIPDRRIVLNNFFWPGTPNLYTLRGAVYRSPLEWRDGLKVIRDLQPDVLLSTHVKPVVGTDEVFRRLSGYMDLVTLVYDQTLRGILAGLGPRDLRSFIHTPAHLIDIPENAEIYGEIEHFPEAIYQYVIGWFDGDVTRLFSLSTTDEAERMVALAGGMDAIVSAVDLAVDREELAWAAQLIQYAYLVAPEDQSVKDRKANVLRQLGYRTIGSAARAFLLSNALQLEGKVQIPNLVPPSPNVVAASPAAFVDFFRVRIDPEKSESIDSVVGFVFDDGDGDDADVALHIRKGIAEYVADPESHYQQPDVVLRMSPETWASVYLGSAGFDDAVAAGDVAILGGSDQSVSDIFEAFDPLRM